MEKIKCYVCCYGGYVLAVGAGCTLFVILVYFIFTQEVIGTTRDLLFIIIGGFLSSFQNVIDYWFKKDKSDHP